MILQPRTWPRWSGPISLALITVAVLFLRRPDQFIAPYIWVEDGRFVLREYLEHGWQTILYPLAGYLVISTKLISAASFKASILYAPQIAVALTTLFTCAVILAVALSPTHLRSPWLCALSVLLIPTGPENFAVSLYSFWWAGILYLLALMWDETRGKAWLRYFFIIFGGLSSPLAVSLSPIFILRAVVERKGWRAAILAVVIACIQTAVMLNQDLTTSVSSLGPGSIQPAIAKLVGDYLLNGIGPWAGLGLLAACAAVVAWNYSRFGWDFAVIVSIYVLVLASIVLRLSNDILLIIDKFDAGPRYFFYPFILLSWVLIWIAVETNDAVRLAIACVFAVSILGAGSRLASSHEHLSWSDEILKCSRSSQGYKLPLQYTGRFEYMWSVEMKGSECADLLQRSLF